MRAQCGVRERCVTLRHRDPRRLIFSNIYTNTIIRPFRCSLLPFYLHSVRILCRQIGAAEAELATPLVFLKVVLSSKLVNCRPRLFPPQGRQMGHVPTNTIRRPHSGVMFGHGLRPWPNITPEWDKCFALVPFTFRDLSCVQLQINPERTHISFTCMHLFPSR